MLISHHFSLFFAKIPWHSKGFILLLDYRLNVINVILIYGLITTQIEIAAMDGNVVNKSTTISTTLPTTGKLLDIPRKISNRKTTKTTTTNDATTSSILLLNRTSSAVFMTDDDDMNCNVDPTFVTEAKMNNNNNNSNSNNNNSKNATINVNVNNFRIGTTNQNMKEHLLVERVVKHKRWIRDLLAMTVKNAATELTSIASTTTTKTTTMKVSSAESFSSIQVLNNSLAASESNKSTFSNNSNNNRKNKNNISDRSLQLPQQQTKENRILSRSKRFLTFPEGSSFSVAVCITVGIIGNPRFNYMAYGLNWGVAYDLPNASWVINHLHGFSRHPVPATIARRRTRRALYREIETLVDNMGYNGRGCILRALCESRQYFKKHKLSMVGEMLRAVFSLPKQRLFTRELHENSEIELYDHAYRRPRDIDCSEQYDCAFSLLELAFGKYSTPPPGYYQYN